VQTCKHFEHECQCLQHIDHQKHGFLKWLKHHEHKLFEPCMWHLKIEHDKHFEFVATHMNTMNWCLLLACKTLDSKHYDPMKTNNNKWVLNLEDHKKKKKTCNNSNFKLKRSWLNDLLSLESCEVGCAKSMNINNGLFFKCEERFKQPWGLVFQGLTLKQCTFTRFWSLKRTLNHKKHELQSSNRMGIDESQSSKTFTKCNVYTTFKPNNSLPNNPKKQRLGS
jgi:hypothetical protein